MSANTSELQAKSRIIYTAAIELLIAERVHCATQLANDLTNDIESQDISFDPYGILELRNAVEAFSKVTPSCG